VNFLRRVLWRSRSLRAKLVPGGAELGGLAQLDDPSLDRWGCPVWAGVRPAGTIDQSRSAFGPEAVPPLVGGRPRDPHLGGHVRDRRSGRDPQHQRETPSRRQASITVHRALRFERGSSTAPHLPGGLTHPRTPSTRSMLTTPSPGLGNTQSCEVGVQEAETDGVPGVADAARWGQGRAEPGDVPHVDFALDGAVLGAESYQFFDLLV
jgi:hypothetical protein